LKQTNPELKRKTVLVDDDANFSIEEKRAFHPKYYFDPESADPAESRGKKRARAEDFL